MRLASSVTRCRRASKRVAAPENVNAMSRPSSPNVALSTGPSPRREPSGSFARRRIPSRRPSSWNTHHAGEETQADECAPCSQYALISSHSSRAICTSAVQLLLGEFAGRSTPSRFGEADPARLSTPRSPVFRRTSGERRSSSFLRSCSEVWSSGDRVRAPRCYPSSRVCERSTIVTTHRPRSHTVTRVR